MYCLECCGELCVCAKKEKKNQKPALNDKCDYMCKTKLHTC